MFAVLRASKRFPGAFVGDPRERRRAENFIRGFIRRRHAGDHPPTAAPGRTVRRGCGSATASAIVDGVIESRCGRMVACVQWLASERRRASIGCALSTLGADRCTQNTMLLVPNTGCSRQIPSSPETSVPSPGATLRRWLRSHDFTANGCTVAVVASDDIRPRRRQGSEIFMSAGGVVVRCRVDLATRPGDGQAAKLQGLLARYARGELSADDARAILRYESGGSPR